jgi:hypothetical protein
VNRVRFLMLLICLLLFSSAPITLVVTEVVSDAYVNVSIFNSGSAPLQGVTVSCGDKEYAVGDVGGSQGQSVSIRRVAHSKITVRSKDTEGQAATLLQLPSDEVGSVSILVKDGKMQSFSVTARRKLWWR